MSWKTDFAEARRCAISKRRGGGFWAALEELAVHKYQRRHPAQHTEPIWPIAAATIEAREGECAAAQDLVSRLDTWIADAVSGVERPSNDVRDDSYAAFLLRHRWTLADEIRERENRIEELKIQRQLALADGVLGDGIDEEAEVDGFAEIV